EVSQSSWLSNARELVKLMGKIRCEAGATKIARVLRHIRTENECENVDAAIFVGDAVEESESELRDIAAGLGVPLFVFQEGNNVAFTGDGTPRSVEQVFRELARMTGGAYGKFDAGAARQLGEFL